VLGESTMMIGDCKTRMENAFNDLLAAVVRARLPPPYIPHLLPLVLEENKKHFLPIGVGCPSRQTTEKRSIHSCANHPRTFTTQYTIFSSHTPNLLSLARSYLIQDEHGADTTDSEELAAAKAILDEVEPMLEV
jgi:hypothetical protein